MRLEEEKYRNFFLKKKTKKLYSSNRQNETRI